MKAAIFVALIALVGLVAAQAPEAAPTAPTKCDIILGAVTASTTNTTEKFTNANDFLTAVVVTAVGLIQQNVTAAGTKSSLFRYFNGSAPYPNIFNNQANAGVLVGKLVDWFKNYLGCGVPENVISLTASHAALKISRTDAQLFNTRVMQAIAGVLATQGVALTGDVLILAGSVANDLAGLVPTYTVNETLSFCDKYANQLTAAGYGLTFPSENYGAVDFTAALGPDAAEYAANLAQRGPGYAFWSFFIKRGVVFNELVGNTTVNARLGVYFNGSRGTANFFANNGANANLATLVNKLTAWFGVLTGCSDAEFRSWAESTAAVTTAGPINLSASHQNLRITAADNDLFNTAILRQAGAYLTQFGLTAAEGNTVAGLLNSVSSQVVYQPPAPVAAPVAAKAPTVAAPKAAAGSVVASVGLVAVALLALLF